MSNQWSKRERTNKMKTIVIAVLLHAVFFAGLLAYSGSDSDSGLLNWVKTKFQKEQVEEVAMTTPTS